MDFIKLIFPHTGVDMEGGGRCTRLCRWMVYSRATTSAMAERVVVGFFGVLGCVLGVPCLGILSVRDVVVSEGFIRVGREREYRLDSVRTSKEWMGAAGKVRCLKSSRSWCR